MDRKKLICCVRCDQLRYSKDEGTRTVMRCNQTGETIFADQLGPSARMKKCPIIGSAFGDIPVTVGGETLTVNEWAERAGVTAKSIRRRWWEEHMTLAKACTYIPQEQTVMNRPCKGCVHSKSEGGSRTLRLCDFILDEGHRRGCDAGEGCTEYITREDYIAKYGSIPWEKPQIKIW